MGSIVHRIAHRLQQLPIEALPTDIGPPQVLRWRTCRNGGHRDHFVTRIKVNVLEGGSTYLLAIDADFRADSVHLVAGYR
jgi:hypothetical protein